MLILFALHALYVACMAGEEATTTYYRAADFFGRVRYICVCVCVLNAPTYVHDCGLVNLFPTDHRQLPNRTFHTVRALRSQPKKIPSNLEWSIDEL